MDHVIWNHADSPVNPYLVVKKPAPMGQPSPLAEADPLWWRWLRPMHLLRNQLHMVCIVGVYLSIYIIVYIYIYIIVYI